jgi:small-conductance mechanosensitive channel
MKMGSGTGDLIARLFNAGEISLRQVMIEPGLGAAVIVVILAALGSGLLLSLIRRRAGRLSSDESQGPLALVLSAVRKPAALAIWSYAMLGALHLAGQSSWLGDEPKRWAAAFLPVANAGGVIAFFWLLFRLIRALEKRLRQWAEATGNILDDVLVTLVARALRLVIPAVAVFLLLPLVPVPPELEWVVKKAFGMFLIGSVAYLIIKTVNVTEKALLRQNRLDAEDNLQARKVYTQVSVLRKVIVVTVSVIGLASMLMLFDPVRQLGTSILASAGIAGIVLGFAAQKTLGNLFAGIQIALTQPIRIDDVVIVEGEWGRIEEITLTYVVVCIWDLRRLVVPINYFIDKTFQNWTRQSAEILGTVFLYVDYRVPVEAIREELEQRVKSNPLWDGKAWGLQVTNCDRDTIELRCLASAADSSKAWNLRCELREQLIAFIQENYPECLPRVRTEVSPASASFSELLGNRRAND